MKKKPTDKELDILQVLWNKQTATVREVHEALHADAEQAPAYTTTLKQMQIMAEKGLVKRRKAGKSHVYMAAAEPDETRQGLLENLTRRAFGGSASKLVMQALGNKQASAEELAEIRAFLDQLEEAP